MRWAIRLVLLPFVLLAVVAVLIYLPPIQQVIRHKAVTFLKEKIGTEVRLEHFALRFPIGVSLEGLYVEDQAGDTLLFAGTVKARLGVTALFNERIVLGGVELSDVRASVIQSADSSFNFDFVVDAFATAESDTSGSSGRGFTIEDVELNAIDFHLDLAPSKLQLDVALGTLAIDLDDLDAANARYYIDDLVLHDTRVDLRVVSTAPSPDPYPDLTNPLGGLDIRFNSLEGERIAFHMSTTDTGDSLWLDVGSISVDADGMDPARQRIELDALHLDQVHFGTLVHVDTAKAPSEKNIVLHNDGFRYLIRDWAISAKELRVEESSFALHTGSIAEGRSAFDPEHLHFEHIELHAEDLALNNERVAVRIKEIQSTSGPQGTALTASFGLDALPTRIALTDGAFGMAGTELQLEALLHPAGLDALLNEPDHVHAEVRLGTELAPGSLDRLLLALDRPPITTTHATETVAATVKMAGTLQRLDSMAVKLNGDQGSIVDLRGRATDLGNWPHSEFTVDIQRITLGPLMRDLLLPVVPGQVMPTRFTMKGRGSMQAGYLVARLDVRSDLGDLTGDVHAADWTDSLPGSLQVDILATQVDVARFTGDSSIDPVSLRISGEGLHLNDADRKAELHIEPKVLHVRGTDLSSIRGVAQVHGDSVDLQLTGTQAPVDMDLHVSGPLPGPEDPIDATLEIVIRQFQCAGLDLTDHQLDLRGTLRGDLHFGADDPILASLSADGLELSNGQKAFRFERFLAHATLAKDSTKFDLDSDALTVEAWTNLSVDSLIARSTQKFFSILHVDSTFTSEPGRRGSLVVRLLRPELLTELVVPDLHAISLERFEASFDSDNERVSLDIAVPHLLYDSIRIEAMRVDIGITGTELNGLATIGSVSRDNYHISGVRAEAVAKDGRASATLLVQPAEGPVLYRAGVELERIPDGRSIHIQEDLVLNGQAWTADPDNLIRSTEQGIEAEHFILRSGEERIEARTEQDSTLILIHDLEMGTLARVIATNDSVPMAGGRINGHVRLPRVEGGRMVADLRVDQLQILGTDMGAIRLHASEQDSSIRFSADLEHAQNQLAATATLGLGGSTAIEAQVHLDFKDLAALEPFLNDLLFHLDGQLSGDVRYEQQADQVRMHGALAMDRTAVGVIMTGATYTVEHGAIGLDDAGIHFQRMDLLDSLGNRFQLGGDILRTGAMAADLDLRVSTDRFQVTSSTIEQNSSFFGDLFASADLQLKGPIRHPVLSGSLGVLEGTKFSVVLPATEVKLIDSEGIVVFTDDLLAYDTVKVSADNRMLRDSIAARLPGIALDLRLTTDKKAQFAAVLDPTTGDQATFSGAADLTFRYEPGGEMYLSGPFVVEDGGYTLEFYGLVRKRFDLVRGSSLTWNGDPLEATMDIRARYVSNSAPYPLIATPNSTITEVEKNRLKQPIPFQVSIAVLGTMGEPEVDLGLDLDASLRNSFPQVSDRLDQLAQPGNEESRNRQVFGLLVLNSFIEENGTDGNTNSSIATSAARNSVNGLLTAQMNQLTGNYIKGVDISLGVNTYDQTSGSQTYQRTSLDYKVSKSVLDDRLSFEVDGSIGLDENTNQLSNMSNNRAAQYAILYDLTPDGRFRIRGFQENAYDLFDGEIRNSGVAFMFTKDFEENEAARTKARKEQRERLEQHRREQGSKQE